MLNFIEFRLKKYFRIIDSMLSKQNLIKTFRSKKNNKCVQMLFATIVDTILNVIQSRERNQTKKIYSQFFIQSKKYFRLSRNFFPARSKKREKKQKIYFHEKFSSRKIEKNFFALQKTKQQTFQTQSTSLENSFPPKRTSPKNYIPLPIYIYMAFFKLF